MKELDLMLEAHLERLQQLADESQLELFETLLEQEDDLLWHWLQGMKRPEREDFAVLVDSIRRGA
jgi:succinate dehydrogenase flavin-adding protein (antitoxin of CptAB toxin-antitoxin module)